MTKDNEVSGHDAWARLKFSVVGPLLAAPPPHGELDAELHKLARKHWRDPITGESRKFGFSTIERWYYIAKDSRDPIRALRRKPREDAGTQPSLNPELCMKLRKQYAAHKRWSYQLHVDNLAVLVEEDSALGSMPSYSTLRHLLKSAGNTGLFTDELKSSLCEHAAGNYRILTTMAGELLAVAAQRECTQIDEKLFFEVFQPPGRSNATAGSRSPPRRRR